MTLQTTQEPFVKTKRSSLIHNLVLSLVSFLVLLLAVEIILQFVSPPPARQEVFVHERSANPKLLYKTKPRTANYSYKVLNQINSGGFRDREFAAEKTPGLPRVVFLGDSVVYGYGLPLEQTLPKQLEAIFQNHSRLVEVLNMGVSGYESEQEVEFFKEVGLNYHPDIVLVGYTLNDSNYASWELDLFHSQLHLDLPESSSSPRDGFKAFLGFIYDHSALASFLDRRLHLQRRIRWLSASSAPLVSLHDYIKKKNTLSKDPLDSPYRSLEAQIRLDAEHLGTSEGSLKHLMGCTGFWADDFHSSHWNVSRQAFLELKSLSEKNNFKVVVVIFPIFQEMRKYPLSSLHHFLSEQFKEMGFPVIDLLEFGKEIDKRFGRPTISNDSLHLTAVSSSLIAEYLYEELGKLPLGIPQSQESKNVR